MTAPAPGLISLAMRNAHYDFEQAYLDALAAALRVEYSKIAEAGFVLQIDLPDLGMERSRTYRDRPLSDFLDFAERAVAAINSAIGDIPPERVRLHVCWGNSEGPHDEDVPLADIIGCFAQRAWEPGCCRLPIPATPTNTGIWISCSWATSYRRWCDRHHHQLHRASRGDR